ncbi:MAG TPA: hypothetical protein VFE62_15045 [Gemmataceae bacterium]|nr:hypothetical protein [Gemmataceae bacterium]
MDAATRLATAAAFDLFAELVRSGVHVGEVTASATGQGMTVTVRVGPAEASPVAPEAAPATRTRQETVARLTPAMRAILGVLNATTPSKVSQIATRLGKNPGGSLRFLCSMLELLDLIRHVKGGYVLA